MKTGGDEIGLRCARGQPFQDRTAGQASNWEGINMDLRTKKQKAIGDSAALIANRIYGVIHHGDNMQRVSVDEIRKILEQEFEDVHEIQEDDGK